MTDPFSELPHVDSVRHGFLAANGLRFHVAAAGDARAAGLVVLLHGFPEGWYGWRRQMTALAERGFLVVAPDLRGYGLSDRPGPIEGYALPSLAADVAELIAALGHQRAHLVGHDFGGILAWWIGTVHPERVQRLAILNAPHPLAFRQALRERPAQWLRSWYMALFQLPWAPERLLAAGRFRVLREVMVRSARPGTFSAAELQEYCRAWAHPGALRTMLNWYRALFRTPLSPARQLPMPVRILWGERDRYLIPELADRSARLCAQAQVVRFPDASHWLHHEAPEAVNACLAEFLAGR